MIRVRLSRGRAVGVRGGVVAALVAGLVGLVALTGVGVAPAYGEALAPWWGVTLGARPSALQAGLARDEAQEVAVSATGGEFVLTDEKTGSSQFFKWDATHQEVQEGLETLFGKGNVQVAGGPGDETGARGWGKALYFFDPDKHLIEIRHYDGA